MNDIVPFTDPRDSQPAEWEPPVNYEAEQKEIAF